MVFVPCHACTLAGSPMSQDTVEGKDFIEESGALPSEAQQEPRGWVTY